MNRRRFLLQSSAALGALPGLTSLGAELDLDAALQRLLRQPVLDLSAVREPVVVESIELLHNGPHFLLRSRSRDGAVAVTVPHQEKMGVFWPVLLKNVLPVFLKQDARKLESLIWDAYRHQSNYKMQGMSLWICIAAIEMILL